MMTTAGPVASFQRLHASFVYDLERLSTRVTVNRATPRDFIALGNSLAALPAVLAALTQPPDGKYPLPGQENGEDAPRVIHELLKGWDDLADCAHLLRSVRSR